MSNPLSHQEISERFRESGSLDRVHLRQRRSHDHRVAHPATKRIDAFRKTGAEHEEQPVAE